MILHKICDKNLSSGKIGINKSFTGNGKATLIKVSLDSQLAAKAYLLNSKLRPRFQEQLLLNFLNFIYEQKIFEKSTCHGRAATIKACLEFRQAMSDKLSTFDSKTFVKTKGIWKFKW